MTERESRPPSDLFTGSGPRLFLPPSAGRDWGPLRSLSLPPRRERVGVRVGPMQRAPTLPEPRAMPRATRRARRRIAEFGRMAYRGQPPERNARHGHPSVAHPSVVCGRRMRERQRCSDDLRSRPEPRGSSHDPARRFLEPVNGGQDRESKGPQVSTGNWRNVETGRLASQRLPSYAGLRILWPNSS